MALVHKTVDVRPEVWRKLRLNAELSQVRLRDYLTYLIMQSTPLTAEHQDISEIVAQNDAARAEHRSQ